MVKVVSDKPVKTKRMTCANCGYELEYTGEDVIRHADSDGDVTTFICCPRLTCNKSNTVTWP